LYESTLKFLADYDALFPAEFSTIKKELLLKAVADITKIGLPSNYSTWVFERKLKVCFFILIDMYFEN
jgi:hypothetical protein